MKINWKELSVKPRVNKANGQINFSLPRKQMTKEILDKVSSGKSIKLLFEDL